MKENYTAEELQRVKELYSRGEYDEAYDVNMDGKIDMADIGIIARAQAVPPPNIGTIVVVLLIVGIVLLIVWKFK